jgi:4-oxalocrotonate tautomerase
LAQPVRTRRPVQLFLPLTRAARQRGLLLQFDVEDDRRPRDGRGRAWYDHGLAIGLAFMRYNAVNAQRETEMPEIYVHAVKGRTLDQKRALVKDITDAVVKNFSVPLEAVVVEIIESEPTAKAKGGVLFSEMRR